MVDLERKSKETHFLRESGEAGFLPFLAGVVVPIGTFALAISRLPYWAKIAGLVVIAGFSTLMCARSLFRDRRARIAEQDLADPAERRVLSTQAADDGSGPLSDRVTGLANERALRIVLENQLAECRRRPDERPLAVVAVEIAGFDEITRIYGRETCDGLMRTVAVRLSHQIRNMDLPARLSGGQFAIVLPTATGKAAVEIIERIEEAFESEAFSTPEAIIPVRLHIGYSVFGTDGDGVQELLEAALLSKEAARQSEESRTSAAAGEFVN